jgi:hypothetical protein
VEYITHAQALAAASHAALAPMVWEGAPWHVNARMFRGYRGGIDAEDGEDTAKLLHSEWARPVRCLRVSARLTASRRGASGDCGPSLALLSRENAALQAELTEVRSLCVECGWRLRRRHRCDLSPSTPPRLPSCRSLCCGAVQQGPGSGAAAGR